MDRLTGIEVFVEVAEQGGFSAAARRLGLSNSAVSKHVAALEERLAVRLINRTTRKLALTEAGTAYYERCTRLLAELGEAEAAVSELHAEPRGTLRVNAPMSFGQLYLGEAIADFLELHPHLRVELTLNDRFVDLMDEGYDLAVRIGALADSSLVARRIAAAPRQLVAAPGYLERHGSPAHPAELAHHRCLGYGHEGQGEEWTLERGGERQRVRVAGPFRANNGDVLKAAAVRGCGIALLPTFIACEELADGRLVAVLADWSLPEAALSAVYPPSRRVSAKVRAFIDFLAARFGPMPPWERRLAALRRTR